MSNRDFGKRPYIETGLEDDDDYQTMMRLRTNAEQEDRSRVPWSEFEQPWLLEDYHGMQHFHESNFAPPYLPLDRPRLDRVAPLDICPGAVLNATTSEGDFPRLDCGGSVELIMGGRDGQGRPWNQDDFLWYPLGGPLLLNGTISGNVYTAVGCNDLIDGLGRLLPCGLAGDTIIGYHLGFLSGGGAVSSPGCGFSSVIIRINTPRECEPADACAIGIGNTISGPDAPVDSDEYSVPGVDDVDIVWSISKGSITAGGVVTVTGECGVAIVTAQMCSETITKDVKMPSGVWVSDLICNPGTPGSGACPEHDVVTEFEGVYKFDINTGGGRQRHCGDPNAENCCATTGAPCVAATAVTCPGGGGCAFVPDKLWPHVTRYIWSCP